MVTLFDEDPVRTVPVSPEVTMLLFDDVLIAAPTMTGLTPAGEVVYVQIRYGGSRVDHQRCGGGRRVIRKKPEE